MAGDFFTVVGGGLNNPAVSDAVDDTKSFQEAINARFNATGDNVLTARLFAPLPLDLPTVSDQPIIPSSPSSFTPVLPQSLASWLDDPHTLVVDIRPHAAYASARMSRAISLSVPSTLLKRPLFSLQRLSAMLPSASARAHFSAWRSASRIVVYDADSTTVGETSNINGLLRKFRAEAPDSNMTLAWVVGGFQAIWITRRDLVDTTAPTTETETEDDDTEESDGIHARQRILRAHHLPRAAFSMSSTTQAPHPAQAPFLHNHRLPNGPAAVPQERSDAPETSAFNPFFDSVRQNTELAQGITERIPLRLPRRVRRRISELPFDWLRQIAGKAAPITPPMDPDALSSSGDESSDSSISNVHRFRYSSPAPSPVLVGSPPSALSSLHAFSPPPSSSAASATQSTNVDEGTEALAMQFYRIELAEQRRLMNVLEHHARESGETVAVPSKVVKPFPREDGSRKGNLADNHPFSITAGVEKGSKNRYRNIWPFEHARVRLHRERPRADSMPSFKAAQPQPKPRLSIFGRSREAELVQPRIPSPEYDDYVNASFVQPLGTRRRYIATQGPLESTFGDFWTLLWQQNVHVIVMLTKEIEGAVIKCGNYWHSGRYGPLRVELLGCDADGCTGVCRACAGVSSDEIGAGRGGFFSSYREPKGSPPPLQLIRRTIRLTHEGHPHAPPRRIVQLQYLGWPDMNVPEDARGVLTLVWEMTKVIDELEKESPKVNPADFVGAGDSDVDEKTGVLRRAIRDGNASAPVLLHCSAGVGRTGGFIIVDAILDAIRMEVRELYATGRGDHVARAPNSGSGSGSGSEGVLPLSSATGSNSGSGSGSGGISAIAARIRETELKSSYPNSEDESMDVDAAKDNSGSSNRRTPMQVDGATPGDKDEMKLGDMGETRRWAQRVADTDVVSAFAPALFPNSAASSSSSLPLSTSFPATPAPSFPSTPSLGAPFQLQQPVRRQAFALAMPPTRSLPTAREAREPRNQVSTDDDSTSDSKSRTPSIAARRSNNVDQRIRTTSEPSGPGADSESRVASPAPPANPQMLLRPPQIGLGDSFGPYRDRSASATPFEAKMLINRPADYKQPRSLHTHNGPAPVLLSTLENPISEVLQDMRTQRMSLCQSLRQYVFVHAAIIEGALMVADEERARARVALRLPRTVASRPRLVLDDVHSSPTTGKRLASPTELPKEDKKGEIALSKRPSIKRKQESSDEYSPPLPTYPPP
ncbi:hypothetical protein HMN09_00588800 [Mycena chlorophos]|uniref:protein-tyrosine-phosphatase n=1 Tax=Mycena chlorophos TaxID=658473 RepID=A0A8H6WFF4_MYCCL|nr:hypothetical protein HMN09_00588800 [Mycena chlorophos]